MSPRAACRLESLGFWQVYDYAAGKADWFAYGLPREGRDAAIPRAGEIARSDVPVCGLADRLSDVRKRLRETGWETCIVVNDERVVLGRLRKEALDAADSALAEQVMEAGPTTTRPDTRLDTLRDRLRQRDIDQMLVTTSDGRLVGILARASIELRLGDDGDLNCSAAAPESAAIPADDAAPGACQDIG